MFLMDTTTVSIKNIQLICTHLNVSHKKISQAFKSGNKIFTRIIKGLIRTRIRFWNIIIKPKACIFRTECITPSIFLILTNTFLSYPNPNAGFFLLKNVATFFMCVFCVSVIFLVNISTVVNLS